MPDIIKLFVIIIGLHGWIVLTLEQVKGIRNGQSGAHLGLATVTLLGLSIAVMALIWFFEWPRTTVTLGPAIILFVAAAATALVGLRAQRRRDAAVPPLPPKAE